MELDTLLLLRQCLYGVTLKVGDPDFQEVAPRVLKALAALDEGIRDATGDKWPGVT